LDGKKGLPVDKKGADLNKKDLQTKKKLSHKDEGSSSKKAEQIPTITVNADNVISEKQLVKARTITCNSFRLSC